MKNDRLKILAIKPGSKYLGLAVFKEVELINWSIKKLKSKGMPAAGVRDKVKKIVERAIGDYKPDIVAMEKLALSQTERSLLLKEVVAEITGLAKRKVKRIYSFPSLKVKEFICQEDKATKMNLERAIVSRYYPWLYHRYEKDRLKDVKGQWWKRKYHSTLFDAIALGLYCLQKLNKGASS